MEKTITVTKLDETPPKSEPKSILKKGGKTLKTYPRGILKTAKQKSVIKGVTDPAKPPGLKKTMRTHTIRLLTDKGVRRHRKTIKKKIAGMSNDKVKEIVTKNGLLKNANTPPSVMREMLEGGAIAGFISLK